MRVRLTGEEARARLAAARVARLATAGSDGLPHLVPVTFAVDGDHVRLAVPPRRGEPRHPLGGEPRPRVLCGQPHAPILPPATWARAAGAHGEPVNLRSAVREDSTPP